MRVHPAAFSPEIRAGLTRCDGWPVVEKLLAMIRDDLERGASVDEVRGRQLALAIEVADAQGLADDHPSRMQTVRLVNQLVDFAAGIAPTMPPLKMVG